MENQPDIDSAQNLEKEDKSYQISSYWVCFIFGHYYLAYKGFLKRAVYFGILNIIILIISVDYIFQPRYESLEYILHAIINLGINFFIAFTWDDYVKGDNVKPNTRYPFTNITITLFTILLSISLIQIIETKIYDIKLNSARELEKNGKENEAFDTYISLCSKEVSEACFLVGHSFANLDLHEKSAKYFSKSCKLDHGEACYVLGLYLKKKNGKRSESLIRKACELEFEEACNENDK